MRQASPVPDTNDACPLAQPLATPAEKYDLSLQVAQRLLDQIDNQLPGTEVIASDISCSHQKFSYEALSNESGRIAATQKIVSPRHGNPARESRALPRSRLPMVLVARRVLRLRRVSAVRRLRLLDHLEDLRQGLRGYRARRMIRDDWPVLCVTRRFVRL